jgi:hypothetical protein
MDSKLSFKDFCEQYIVVNGNPIKLYDDYVQKMDKMNELFDKGYKSQLLHKRRGGVEWAFYHPTLPTISEKEL